MPRTFGLESTGTERHTAETFGTGNGYLTQKFTVLPLLQVTYQTRPFHTAPACKRLLVIVRKMRLEAEDLDEGTGLFMEMQTGLDNFCVIENEQRSFWQIFRKVTEDILVNGAVATS